MTRPRQILPGSIYIITRRVTQRQFLLKPSKRVNQIFLYCLAVAAKKYGLLIHAVIAISNHYHIVCSDPSGKVARFQQWLNGMLARALNAHRGKWENFWASGTSYSCVRLETPQDCFDKMVYVMLNAVSAGLVPCADQWPGFHTLPSDIGRTFKVKRPKIFFDENGPLPEEAELSIVAPPADCGVEIEELIAMLSKQVAAEETRILRRVP